MLLAGTAAAFALLVAEVAVRVAVPRDRFLSWYDLDYYEGIAREVRGVLQADGELGHAPVLGGRLYDEHGVMRYSRELGGAGPATLFVGDSVTRRGSLVAPLRELAPGRAYWNAGVEAWNPVQEVASYRRTTRAAGHGRVVLTLHNNDLSETPVGLYTDAGFAICRPGCIAAFRPWLYRYSWLYRLSVNARHPELLDPPTVEAMAPRVEAALRGLRDDLRAASIELVVLVLPPLVPEPLWLDAERRARERMLALCSALQLRTIDLLPPVEELHRAGLDVLAQPGDRWHPNADAGLVMAFHALQQGLFAEWPGTLRTDGLVRTAGAAPPQRLLLDFGPQLAGRPFRVLGTAAGCGRGVTPDGIELPILTDAYTAMTLWQGELVMAGGTGVLDPQGRARVEVQGPPLSAVAAPVRLHHVAVVQDERGGVLAVSNPAPLLLVPAAR